MSLVALPSSFIAIAVLIALWRMGVIPGWLAAIVIVLSMLSIVRVFEGALGPLQVLSRSSPPTALPYSPPPSPAVYVDIASQPADHPVKASVAVLQQSGVHIVRPGEVIAAMGPPYGHWDGAFTISGIASHYRAGSHFVLLIHYRSPLDGTAIHTVDSWRYAGETHERANRSRGALDAEARLYNPSGPAQDILGARQPGRHVVTVFEKGVKIASGSYLIVK